MKLSDILEKQHYKPSECIQLSADADLIVEEKLLQHPAYWQEYVDNLNFNQGCFFTSIEGKERLVEFEAFPLMAKRMFSDEGKLYAEVFPGLPMQVQVESFQYDDFDRFVCLSKNKSFPIGLTDSAQNDFFNICDDFDDDSFRFDGKHYEMKDLFEPSNSRNEDFWSAKYKSGNIGFDMKGPHPFLVKNLDQFKFLKSRVLVLGCGRAHDAEYFARQGHIVTAVDISPKAIEAAKALYPESANLKYEQQDILNLPNSFYNKYDIIWDHTFYCAIPPKHRQELVKLWSKCLSEKGRLLGIFFSMYKPEGPPFGGSELELRSRLSKYFRIHYWNRVMEGPVSRLGKEFFCMLEKLETD